MQPLDYEAPPTTAEGKSGILFLVPAVATCMTALFFWHNANEEPFMVFSVEEAVIHVATPLAALGLWAYWGVRARRERVPALAVAAVAAFGALELWLGFSVGLSYFFEGWNS